MAKSTRARYTLEFKQVGGSACRVGPELRQRFPGCLGLIEQTLYNWVKAQRAGSLRGRSRLAGRSPPSRWRSAALRAESGAGEDGARHSGKSYGVLCQGAEVKYAFDSIVTGACGRIRVQCRVLAGECGWLSRTYALGV